MNDLADRLHSYLIALWRYRWEATLVAWVIGIAGWAAVAMLPDRYLASARVYVDTQTVLRPLLAGLAMQPNVPQIVEMMSRTLISRPNVERVIEMSGMKPHSDSVKDREELVARLSRELAIRGTGSQNLYTIAYSERDPEQAKRVVQSLLTIFEENLGDKRKDSDSAISFIEDQLKIYGERLTAAENAVTEFKRKNVGLMPGQGENYYTRLNEARVALNQARLDLAEAEQGRDAIRKRFTVEQPPSLIDEHLADAGETVDTFTSELDGRIQALQQKLDTLRLTYTEQHPDIVAILPVLEHLKQQRQREKDQKMKELAQKKKKAPAPAVASTGPPNLYQQLTMSMAEYDATVASLRARVQEYERRYAELKAAINAMPQVEAQYTQLTRDYEVTKKNYEQLLARRESAQITGDVQSSATSMEFRVIDPPQVANTPEWPNRPLFITAVLLAALVGGIGFAFLMSRLRPTIESERNLREVTGLAVFGTVAMAWNDAQQRRRRQGYLGLAFCVAALFLAYGAMVAAPVAQRVSQVAHFDFFTKQ
jgi:polysaccharide chain length determinant protein (PEP-CTERM system associated)